MAQKGTDTAQLSLPRYDQLVFSGGGTRCFWQGGFLKVTQNALQLEPQRISAVSGGALAACCHVAGRGTKLLEVMGNAFDDQEDHVNHDAFFEDTSLTPHQQMYKSIVSETLDEEAVDTVAKGPPLQITLAKPPKYLPVKSGAFLALALYVVDQKVRSSPHMTLPVAAGTDHIYVDANQAARDGKLVDLVCAAAVIPPVFDLPLWDGQRVMDAGTCDNAPLPRPDDGATLILLTRRYRNTPHHEQRLYVAHSDATPADKIDFTSRQKMEDTWEMGRKDGQAFIEKYSPT